MEIVDARSGRKVAIGDRIDYDDHSWRLLAVDVGLTRAELTIEFLTPGKSRIEKVQAPVSYFDPRFDSWRTVIVPS